MLIVRLGLPAAVGALFAYVDERWDGQGPIKAKGEDTPLAMGSPTWLGTSTLARARRAALVSGHRSLGGGPRKQCRSGASVLLL